MLRQARAVMWAVVMMQTLDSAGLFLLERISGDHEVGLFGVAQRFYVVALLVPVAAGRVLYPALCRAFQAGRGEAVAEDQIRIMTFLVVPPCTLGILLSGTALSLFPTAFAASETSLWIMLFAAMAAGPCSVLATSLIAAGRNRAFAVAVTAGTATSLAGGWMLIPAHGAGGAALAVLAAQCVTGAAALLLHRARKVGIPLLVLLLPAACVAGGAAVLLGLAGPAAALAPVVVWAIGSVRALRLVGATSPPREAV
jgi:O-antigen/teichoic acid export membrane protein